MKKLFHSVLSLFKSRYQVVYKTASGRVQMYTITKPKHSNEFGNAKEGLSIAGFRSYCFNRGGIRSFRYDRVVSLNRG